MRMNVFRLGGFCAALLTGAAVDCAAADPVTVNVESGVDVDIEDAVVLETLISSDADLVKTGGGSGADIHTGTLADSFQAFQNLDLRSAVFF